MNKITEKKLNRLCETINKALGTPATPYTKDAEGNCKANVGNYHIDNAYGGYKLAQMTSETGCIRDVIEGLHSKAQLYDRMQAFLAGAWAAQGKR